MLEQNADKAILIKQFNYKIKRYHVLYSFDHFSTSANVNNVGLKTTLKDDATSSNINHIIA